MNLDKLVRQEPDQAVRKDRLLPRLAGNIDDVVSCWVQADIGKPDERPELAAMLRRNHERFHSGDGVERYPVGHKVKDAAHHDCADTPSLKRERTRYRFVVHNSTAKATNNIVFMVLSSLPISCAFVMRNSAFLSMQ